MTVLPGWQEGMCQSEVDQTTTDRVKKHMNTQDECEEYCKRIPRSTGCLYMPRLRECDAFTYPIEVKREKGSPYRCQIFEKNNDDAKKKTSKPNTPGNLTKQYRTNPHHLYLFYASCARV